MAGKPTIVTVPPTWPTVTQVIDAEGLGADYSGVQADVLARAAARGVAVHQAIEAHVYGMEPEEEMNGDHPQYRAWLRFLAETGFEPRGSEMEVAHAGLRFVGHLDVWGFMGAERWVLDAKCQEQVTAAPLALQLSGYRLAFEDERPAEPVHRTAGLQLKADGTYRVHLVDTRAPMPHGFSAEAVFTAAVVCWWAREGGTS